MLLSDLFDIRNGHSLDLANIAQAAWGNEIAYVSCTQKNNGVTGWAHRIDGKTPAAAGTISVALTGSVLASFIQLDPYYTASHMAILTPKDPAMSMAEKFWWTQCIEANRFRFNYGRKADRTIRSLLIPDEVPSWVSDRCAREGVTRLAELLPTLDVVAVPRTKDGTQQVSDLFDIRYGPSLELVRLKRDPSPNGVNFVSRTSQNNGVSARVALIEGIQPDPPWTLSVALGGSVLETFLQPEPWYSGRDMAVLTPKRTMNIPELLWWATCIRANKYRFNYGRQANRTLGELSIPNYIPNWVGTTPHDAVEEYRDRVLGVSESFAPARTF